MHRELPPAADIRTVELTRDSKCWYIGFQVKVEEAPKRAVLRSVGLDLGINVLAFLSDGTAIPNPRAARSAQRKMRVVRRALARCKRGSKRRRKSRGRLAAAHRKIRDTRRTALHQASAKLIRDYDLVAIEALNVKGLATGTLAREVHDAGWATLIAMLRYKAARAGTHLIEVDPKFTSQDCSGCGARVAKSRAAYPQLRLRMRPGSRPQCCTEHLVPRGQGGSASCGT